MVTITLLAYVQRKTEVLERAPRVHFEKGFDPTLFDCIDESLASVLGRETIDTFYYSIQESYNIPKSKFPEKPLELIEKLRIILGEIGFRVLEKAIVSEIKERFHLYETKQDLVSVISLAKQSYLRTSL